MNEKFTVFLPCRAGSQRVPRKNIKPFAYFQHGLVEVKLRQLLKSHLIDEIVLSTNDLEIIAFAESLGNAKLKLHHRNEELSSSSTSTDQLVSHALDLIPDGHILWTHVTSPFITSAEYDKIIKAYKTQVKNGFDSLMTTTQIFGFLWKDGKPLNYDREIEKWPRTQTLKPVHEVNSGVFLASSNVYKENDDRIGNNPYLYISDNLIGFDVDWPVDFILAETLVEKGLVTL